MSQIHRIFHAAGPIQSTQVEVSKENAFVLQKVLRLQPNDEVTLLDGQGGVYQGIIVSIRKTSAVIEIQSTHQAQKHSPQVCITVGTLKKDKKSWVVQKCTELGVDRISFVDTQHAIARPGKNTHAKLQDVAIEAMRQSGNPFLPKLELHDSLCAALDTHASCEAKFCFHEKKQDFKNLQDPKLGSSVHIMIGPEGGFSQQEIETMQTRGYKVIRCAPYVLRAETAAIFAAAWVKSQ